MVVRIVNSTILFFRLLFWGAYPAGDDMKALFNGNDLSGWVNVIGASDTWTVSNNSINASGVPKSVLRTDRQYENYILEFEYKKPVAFGQAGIIIHGDALPVVGKPWPRGINIQFWSSGNGIIQSVGGAKIQVVSPEHTDMGRPGETDSVSH